MKNMRRTVTLASQIFKLCNVGGYNIQCRNALPRFNHARALSLDARYFSRLEGVTYRPLRPGDIAELCAMSRVAHEDWYSTDYLPGWLPRVIEDDNRLAYVAVRNDSIVGFAMMLCGVDDGKTILGEAGRVHPQHAGSGILTRIFIEILAEAKRRWPRWDVSRGSNIKKHFYQNDLESGAIEPLLNRAYIKVHLKPSNKVLQEKLSSKSGSKYDIERIDPKMLRALLSKGSTKNRLYPEHYIPIGYNIFEPLPSNVPFITYFHDVVFVDKNSSSVSIGGRFPCDDGRAHRYNFNYSGRVDLDCCMEHLMQHLTDCTAAGPTRDDVHFVVMLPGAFKEKFGKDKLLGVLCDQLGVNPGDTSAFTQNMFSYLGFRAGHDKYYQPLDKS